MPYAHPKRNVKPTTWRRAFSDISSSLFWHWNMDKPHPEAGHPRVSCITWTPAEESLHETHHLIPLELTTFSLPSGQCLHLIRYMHTHINACMETLQAVASVPSQHRHVWYSAPLGLWENTIPFSILPLAHGGGSQPAQKYSELLMYVAGYNPAMDSRKASERHKTKPGSLGKVSKQWCSQYNDCSPDSWSSPSMDESMKLPHRVP